MAPSPNRATALTGEGSGIYPLKVARFLAPWRSGEPSLEGDEQEEPAPVRVRTLDPMTGRVISSLTAAALCVKPRGQMTARQVANVDALKAASAEFTSRVLKVLQNR